MKTTREETREIKVQDISVFVCDVCGKEHVPEYDLVRSRESERFEASVVRGIPDGWGCVYDDEYEEAQWHICPDHDIESLLDEESDHE